MHRADSAIAMVQREHTLRRGLRAIKLLYQLESFIERRAHASGGSDEDASQTLQARRNRTHDYDGSRNRDRRAPPCPHMWP